MIKKLSPEFIYSFRDKINKTNSDLDQLFESINSSFISSTNKNDKYKNIKLIGHFKKSTNKWKKSLEVKNTDANNSIKHILKNCVNKLSSDNFQKVSDDLIFSIDITDHISLIILCNEIFNSIIMHPIYIDLYMKLIKKIYYVTYDHWVFDDNNIINVLITMSQLKYFIDYNNINDLESLIDPILLNNMKYIELEGLDKDELLIVNKSMKISNIKFIVKNYLEGFISINTFEYILNDLIKIRNTSSIEALIEVLNICDFNNKEILNNIDKLYDLKNSNDFDFRLKFIYGEALSKFKYEKKPYKKKIVKKSSKKDSYKIGCENILEEYIMIEELEEIYEYLKSSDNNYSELCKFSEILIRYLLCCKEKNFSKLKSLLKILINKRILKASNLRKGFNNNLKKFNDIIIDYPIADKNLNKFINYNKKTNLVKKEFLNELLERYNINY